MNDFQAVNDFQVALLKYPDKLWNYTHMSYNTSITFDYVLKHRNKPWCWTNLCLNPSITIQDVLDYPNQPWDWVALSCNPSITLEDALKCPGKPWAYEHFSAPHRRSNKPDRSKQHLTEFKKALKRPIKLNYGKLSINTAITFEYVLEHLNERWSWSSLSGNVAITFDDVIEHPNFPWDWGLLSGNTSVTFLQHEKNRKTARAACYFYTNQLCRVRDVNQYISEFC